MTKNNVAVTNMDNGVRIVLTKDEFERSRGLFSENSVFEYTNEPVTSTQYNTNKYNPDKNYELLMRTVAMMYRGKTHETNRTATI